jgi:hypothetical protein
MSDFELVMPSTKDKLESIYGGGVSWIATFEVPIVEDTWRLILPIRKSAKWNARKKKARMRRLARRTSKLMRRYGFDGNSYDGTAYSISLM